MLEAFYTGEAAEPRPMLDHTTRARDAWNRIQKLIDTGDSVTGLPLTEEQIEALHRAAVRGFWLYPVVCLALGRPRVRA